MVDDRGKKGKEKIKDTRFEVGLPTISDGQLLFLMNMVSKMKHNTELGSRIATVHNGSALFTGDAGGGESEIRKHIIENDWLECIIALPKNIFYNTGIPTYVWIVSNKKKEERKGKVQLINALELYVKLRKNLGDKNCELTENHIEEITQLYTDFKETDISKIYPNDYFGYNKITVERPLRLSAQFTDELIETLRFDNGISEEMQWVYEKFSKDVYSKINELKPQIENYLSKNEIKLTNSNKKKLFSQVFWKDQLQLLNDTKKLQEEIGIKQFYDFNEFKKLVAKTIKDLKIKLDAKTLKLILNAVSWKNEDAERVIKKTEKEGTIIYEPDTDLRDTENVPLDEDIQTYFEREVLQHIPDAWIDHSKTVKGYEISFTRYFYNYVPPRSIEEITAEILQLEKETDGILNEIVND
ncbi:MAG: N-6 DNA methylase [Bacteroidota bacterium]|nr:N-6 DNA methylase [Bacteroidota bacterium]